MNDAQRQILLRWTDEAHKAYDNGYYLQSVIIDLNLINHFMRDLIHGHAHKLTMELTGSSKRHPYLEDLIFNTRNKLAGGASDRSLYKEARRLKIVSENLYKELDMLYKRRNLVLHRLFSEEYAKRESDNKELLKQLATDYKSTPYFDLGRLLVARTAIEQGKPDAAIGELRQLAEGANSAEIGDVARLRLGRLLIQEEKYDEALKVLVPPRGSALGARYHEVRGDAYYAMGKNAEAAREYTAALTPEDVGVIDSAFVRAKLEEVGGGAVAGMAASDVAPAAPAN